MDDRDIHEIGIRLAGIHFDAAKLSSLVSTYNRGTADVAGFEVALTNPQKAGLKSEIAALDASLVATAASLTTPTGKAGNADGSAVEAVQASPGKAISGLTNMLERTQQLLQVTPRRQPNNSYRVVFPDEAAQQVADWGATVRDAMKLYVGFEKVKAGL